jgi:hypothetical protein
MPIGNRTSSGLAPPRLRGPGRVACLIVVALAVVGCGMAAPARPGSGAAAPISVASGSYGTAAIQGSHVAGGTTLTFNTNSASTFSNATSAHGSASATQAVDVYAYTSGQQKNLPAIVASLPAVVNGVSWVFRWQDIEASRGVFDWSAVDAAISASASSGRKTMLRIDAGAYSPSWVPNQLTFSFKPPGKQPFMKVTMPRTWDPTYVADWTGFIKVYGARYDNDPRVTRIEMPGGGWLGEMGLPQWPGWIKAGYSDPLMEKAWANFIAAYRAAFPHHPSALDFAQPLSVYYQSQITPAVIAYGATYGASVNFQENGLKGSTSESGTVFKTILHYSATTKVGWQLWAGNLSVTELMQSFKTVHDSHASYVEVYLSNCTNKADLPALNFLARG